MATNAIIHYDWTMNAQEQKKEITNSLRLIVKIFEECGSNYRILGSVLIVAYKNKVFRRINDVDILLDEKNRDCVYEKLRQEGFIFHKRRWVGFQWIEAKKENHLGLTFFLIGTFTKNYFRCSLFGGFELRINAEYLQPTKYIFNNIEFVGIPVSSSIAGINQAFLNPKRTLDKEVLREEIKAMKIKTYGNVNVYFLGIKIPFLYDIFSFFYNIYGGIRVMLGKKYEAWD